MKGVGHVTYMGEQRNAYILLMGKSEGERLLGRPRHRWEDYIRTDLKEHDVRTQSGIRGSE
jgi:hypothetical protein